MLSRSAGHKTTILNESFGLAGQLGDQTTPPSRQAFLG
jgi:hypothetical protein